MENNSWLAPASLSGYSMFEEMFQMLPSYLFEFLPLQVPDFSITDLSSESDEIPDILALDEEGLQDFSRPNGPISTAQRAE